MGDLWSPTLVAPFPVVGAPFACASGVEFVGVGATTPDIVCDGVVACSASALFEVRFFRVVSEKLTHASSWRCVRRSRTSRRRGGYVRNG